MKTKLFLEGVSGLGKSAMIYTQVKKSGVSCAGFFSRRLTDAAGMTMAFQLVPYREAALLPKLYRGGEENVFLLHPGTSKAEIHLEVFDRIREITGAYQRADVLILDEIGGMEMQQPIYRKFLDELLTSDIPCIGVLKSVGNHHRMRNRVAEAKKALPYYQNLRECLVREYKSEIYSVGEVNRETALRLVSNFLRSNCF